MTMAPTSMLPMPVSHSTPAKASASPIPVRTSGRSTRSTMATAAVNTGIVAPSSDAAKAVVIRSPTRYSVWLSTIPSTDSAAMRA
jgi:hypothetical protein